MTAVAVSPAYVPGEDAAGRSVWLWDVLFVLATTATAVLVGLADAPLPRRLGAIALVLACCLGWAVVGRRLALQRERGQLAGTAYLGALAACLVAAVALVEVANWAAFVVVPQLFWLLPIGRAIVATVLVTLLIPVTSAVSRGRDAAEAVGGLAPQVLFLTGFGVLVGIYIHRVALESDERGRLIAQLEASRARVAELSHRAGVATERERLAGEIHDTLAQGFTSIVTLLQAAQAEWDTEAPAARRHVDLAVRSAKENLQEARHLVAASTPVALPGHSLTGAVGRSAERFSEETGVHVVQETAGPPRRLAAETEIVLLRATQELLANAARHAAARTVTIRLDFTEPDAVTLGVADDGSGFDPAVVGADSFGLAMMRTRVERLGGGLAVDAAPGRGTTVTVRVPDTAPREDR